MKRLLACLLLVSLFSSLCPFALSEESAVYEPLQYGSQGDAVTAIQQCLKDLGYYTG